MDINKLYSKRSTELFTIHAFYLRPTFKSNVELKCILEIFNNILSCGLFRRQVYFL